MRTSKLHILTMSNVALLLGVTFWGSMHHYFPIMAKHISYPEFIVYSMWYTEKTDTLELIVGNTDKLKMFRPKNLFISISNISKVDLEPALDKIDYGFGARMKTISFDIPY